MAIAFGKVSQAKRAGSIETVDAQRRSCPIARGGCVMGTHAARNEASVRLGLLIALLAVALGIAIYHWKFAAEERQFRAAIVGFEVTSEPDPARNPPVRESVEATVQFSNGGSAEETISKARVVVSSQEDFSGARSWSPTLHRDAMLLDLKLAPGESITEKFVIPWTGRQETRYFPDDAKIYLGLSISYPTPDGQSITQTERFGYVIQRKGRIESSDHQPLVLEIPNG